MLQSIECWKRKAACSEEGDEVAAEYAKNQGIANGVHLFYIADTEERVSQSIYFIMTCLLERMKEEGSCPTPFVDKNQTLNCFKPEDILLGQTVTLDEELHLVIDTMQDEQGRLYIPLFTNEEELEKGQTANILMRFPITEIVREGLGREDVEGIVINPFGESLILPKHALQTLMDHLQD